MHCRTILLTVVACLFAVSSAPAQDVKTNGKRRNVVLIVADDLGLDLGCYGDKVARTPNLDALAKNGIRFSHGYATVASCSPSRASLYTGLFTHQNGQYGLAHAEHAQQTLARIQSLPYLLRRAGYLTGIIGKVHVLPSAVYPWDAEIAKANPRSGKAMADRAREFLTQAGRKPFLLVMGYTDTHRAAKGFGNEAFAKDANEVRFDPKQVPVPPFLPDRPEVRDELAEYYQSMARLDRNVGMLMDVLREMGVLDETLIIFVSDNGIPFPGAKTTQYAAGLHLPLIVSCPGQPKGRTNNAMASWVDVAPTILDWAGAKGPSYKLPGRSLLPILAEDNPKGWDTVYGSHQFHEITMYYPMRSIRTRTHSYILNLANGLEGPLASDLWGSKTWQGILKRGDTMMGQKSVKEFLFRPREELYDLTKDPHELKNVAADSAYADVLRDLRQRLRTWQDETNDPWTILYRNEKIGTR